MKFSMFLAIFFYSICPVLAGTPAAQEFAYGLLLDTQGDGAIYSLVVPDDVYRHTQRADLGDVRVLNASGEAVPHVLREAFENESDLRTQEDVPFFPLVGDAEGPKGTDLAVNVKRRADGMIISIETDNAAVSGKKGIGSYILDLSGLKTEIGKLCFTWNSGELPFTTVRLLQSDDLIHWRSLVDSATLADLEYNGHRVAQKDIVLPFKPLKYLKMTGDKGQKPPDLQKVTALPEKLAMRQQRRWFSLGSGLVGHERVRTVIDYTSEFHLPVNGARVRFPEVNSMIRASVQSRPDGKSPWVSRCSAVFYSLKMGSAGMDNDICLFGRTNDRQWRLEIIEDGAGLEKNDRAPSLELGWNAAEILFVARGPAPFTLAYGSGLIAGNPGQSATGMILQAVSGKHPEQLVRPAVLGKKIELGGKSALEAPPPPLPWKQWILWAVLLVGIGLLALMVRHLQREMRTRGNDGLEDEKQG
jgi:hypothetical protein